MLLYSFGSTFRSICITLVRV